MLGYLVLTVLFLILFAVLLFVLEPRMVEKRLAQVQNQLAERQMEELQSNYRELRGWRHDWRNHMQALKVYVDGGDLDKAADYIVQMGEAFERVAQTVKSGNAMADAIINSKLSLAREKGIAMDATFHIPEILPISDVEFCVLFGNLMDNAIESCLTIPEKEKRFIRIYISTFQEQFYLSISNATAKMTRTATYFSGKGKGHGFGMMNIDSVVKHHKGYLNRSNEPGVFQTELMIPYYSERQISFVIHYK